MTEKKIKQLLSEFNYKRNDINDTKDFLLLMLNYIKKLNK